MKSFLIYKIDTEILQFLESKIKKTKRQVVKNINSFTSSEFLYFKHIH